MVVRQGNQSFVVSGVEVKWVDMFSVSCLLSPSTNDHAFYLV